MKLKQVGEVLHLAKSGKLIVRLNPSYDLSIIGQSVVDKKGHKNRENHRITWASKISPSISVTNS